MVVFSMWAFLFWTGCSVLAMSHALVVSMKLRDLFSVLDFQQDVS